MKKGKLVITIFLLLVLVVTMGGCKKEPPEQVGTWEATKLVGNNKHEEPMTENPFHLIIREDGTAEFQYEGTHNDMTWIEKDGVLEMSLIDDKNNVITCEMGENGELIMNLFFTGYIHFKRIA